MTSKKSLGGLLADDIEVAKFRIVNDRAIQDLSGPRQGQRRRALHVSDFTASDEEFCARAVLARWWRGEQQEFTSLIQRDGKFREQKWHEQFTQAGIVVSYQPEFRLGLLVGHPDWVLDWGYGPRVIDLTGQDRRNDFIALARFLARKKRQVRLYNVMSNMGRGFVIAEDKASCEYRVIPIDRSAKDEEPLVLRVGVVSQAVSGLARDPSDMDVVRAMRVMPRCGRARCQWCNREEHQVLAEAEALVNAPGLLQTAPDGPGQGEASLPAEAEADALLARLDAPAEVIGEGESE